jgi:uncharacterized membrane protein YhaH (DUF805 family)
MQYLSRLFFSFDGRIRRADYWIAFVILGAVSILGSLIIQPDYFTAAVTRPVAQAVLTLVLAVPQSAVCIKRFRDLEWPAWVAYALVGASTAATIAFDSNITIDGTPGNLALSLAVLALLLSEVIPCGFLKGTSPTSDAAIAR